MARCKCPANSEKVAARGEAGEGGFQIGPLGGFGAELADQLLEIGAGMRQAGDVFK